VQAKTEQYITNPPPPKRVQWLVSDRVIESAVVCPYSAVAKGKRLQHDSTHVVEEWQEGVDGCVNRWDIEAPRPKLTFAEAWADRKQFTPLYLLKLYSPTFTGYGSYELNSVRLLLCTKSASSSHCVCC
jgi:hypothetical protein